MSNQLENENASSAPTSANPTAFAALRQTGNEPIAAISTEPEEGPKKSSTVSPGCREQAPKEPSTISAAKVEANRRNAQQSTGPKTEMGKAHSRCNAMKHGILSSALLIKSGYGAEDAQEFELFCADLCEDIHPVGILEEMQVERIAVCWWRQKRVLQAEAGRISRAFADADPKFLLPDLDPFNNPARATLRDHLRVPLGAGLDCLLRYETSNQRQLINALNLLERLQRARKGEHVPAPVTVEVSSSK